MQLFCQKAVFHQVINQLNQDKVVCEITQLKQIQGRSFYIGILQEVPVSPLKRLSSAVKFLDTVLCLIFK